MSQNATTMCVITHTHDPDRKRPASHGYLCHGCDKHLERTVAEIPALVDELEQTLARISTGNRPRVSGNAETALPYAPKAANALRHLNLYLGTWAMHVADTRGVTMPQPSISAYATFLVAHHDWLVHQPEIDDYHRAMLEVARDARASIAPSITRRIDLGLCDDVIACDIATHAELHCPGLLRAVVGDDGLVPDVVCTECETTHTPAQFRALARRLRKGEDAWLTTAQVSSLLQVPSGTVRRWAVEDDWRRLERTETKATRWRSEDVQVTYEARRTVPTRDDVRETRRHA